MIPVCSVACLLACCKPQNLRTFAAFSYIKLTKVLFPVQYNLVNANTVNTKKYLHPGLYDVFSIDITS